MKRLIRKWWLLRELRKDCNGHVMTLDVGALQCNAKYVVAREALVLHVAKKSLTRFSWILWWRKKEDSVKLKKRINDYNSIFDSCIREDLVIIEKEGVLKDQKTGEILNPAGRPFFRTTDLGDDYISQFFYKTFLDNAYAKAIIIGLITAIITTFVGIYVKQIFKDINQPPVVNVYPNITSPDINPTINVYPNAQPNQ